MNKSTNISFALALVVFCIGLVTTTSSGTDSDANNSKVYIYRKLETADFKSVYLAVGISREDEHVTAVFKCSRDKWETIFKIFFESNTELIYINTLEGLPVSGLFAIVKRYPDEFYARLLPHLLAVTSPAIVTHNLPSEFIKKLTPEDKKKIPSMVLANFEELNPQPLE